MDNKEVCQFLDATGASDVATAQHFLEMADGDVNAAVSIFMDNMATNDRGDIAQNNEPVDPNYSSTTDFPSGEAFRAPDPQYTQQLLSTTPDRGVMWGDRSGESYGVPSSFAADNGGIGDSSHSLRAPAELLCSESYDRARQIASARGHWLLVNIQELNSVECVNLNSDVWKSSIIRDILKDSFVFWQQTSTSEEGNAFCELYEVRSFPYVGMIDPTTGQVLKAWPIEALPDAAATVSQLLDFIEESRRSDRLQMNTSRATVVSSSESKDCGVTCLDLNEPNVAYTRMRDSPKNEGCRSPADHYTNRDGRISDIEANPTEDQVDGSDGNSRNVDVESVNQLDGSNVNNAMSSGFYCGPSGATTVTEYSTINNELQSLRRLREERRRQQASCNGELDNADGKNEGSVSP